MQESIVIDKLDRQRAFWTRENHDRPLFGITGTYFHSDTVRMLGQTEGVLMPGSVDFERIADQVDEEFEQWRDRTGDLFWSGSPFQQFFGWLSAVVGGRLQLKADMIWCERFIDDYGDLAGGVDEGWTELLFALLDMLSSRSAGRYPIAPKAMLSPLGILAEVRGNTELAFDIVDRPEEVERAMAYLTDEWVKLARSNFDHIPDWNGGYTTAPRYIWAPGTVFEFDEDPAFMFSPDQHRRFVVPSHVEVMRHFDYSYIHLHSTQLHTLDNLLALDEMAAIELTPDHGESISDLVPAIARIRDSKPVLVHGYMAAEEMQEIARRVPPEGLCLISRVDTTEDALRLQDALLG